MSTQSRLARRIKGLSRNSAWVSLNCASAKSGLRFMGSYLDGRLYRANRRLKIFSFAIYFVVLIVIAMVCFLIWVV